MKLGGLQKHTLIDFPGNIACTVFTIGCNFKCPFCHNPELVLPSLFPKREDQVQVSDLFSFLNKRKGLVDGVVITGGEPCIHPDLAEFCHTIKEMGFRVKLDTNGTRPHTLELLFKEQLVDYVAMDIKSNPATYSFAAGVEVNFKSVQQSIDLIIKNAPAYEFRTTCVNSLMDEKIIKDIGKLIKGAKKYILQPCNSNVNVLNPDFFQQQDGFFSQKELFCLKGIAENFVENCELR